MEAPIVTIRSLLIDNWDASNTADSTPNVHTGWYNSSSKKPQISITDPDENEISGSPTGYTGIGAGSPNTEYVGLVYGNTWVTRPQTNEFSDISNPKQLSHKFKEEVDRILRDNAGNPGGDLGVVGPVTINRRVEPERTPTVIRHEITIGYNYQK